MLSMSTIDTSAMNTKEPQILCVDSDVAGLVLLDAILSPRGYAVIRVNTGREALEVLERETIDLILLGVILPGTDGFAICAQIRADERFRDIPVVMMSALKSREDLLRGIQAGADDYLFKPLDHEEMLARIKMRLNRKQLRDSFNHAYRDMNNLMVLSQEMIETFNTSRFDFQADVDRIITLLVGRTMDTVHKPRTVMMGVMSDNQSWQWFHYEYAFQELNRVKLDFNPISGVLLPEKNKPKIFLLAGRPMETAASLLVKNIQARNMPIENGIGYLSHDLCILAVNYGHEVSDYHVHFLQHVIVQSQFLHSLSRQFQEVGKAFDYTVYALARAAEAADDDAGNHIYRVGEYCGILAERLGMKADFVHAISIQATLHDVGKIYVPSPILRKTDPLNAEEWMEFRKHTLWGAKIIGSNPHLQIGQSIALNHHEKWDGSGYPRGLKGDAIPIEARIAAIADQYDTLRTGRRQKEALDHATVTKILNHGDGRVRPQHFDPLILKAYRETAFLFEEVYNRRKG